MRTTALLLSFLPTVVGKSHIWVLGDSWAEGSFNQIATSCSGATVTNHGVGGSTADQWATTTTGEFSLNPPALATHVWLSVGGNDFLGECKVPSDMAANMAGVIARIHTALPNIPILLFGYTVPSGGYAGDDPSETACATPSATTPLATIIRQAADADSGTTWVNIAGTLGGNADTETRSSTAYYGDAIHPNVAGYAKLFELPAVQQFFECIETTPSPTSSPTSEGNGGGGGEGDAESSVGGGGSSPCFGRSVHACRAYTVATLAATAWESCYGTVLVRVAERVPMTSLVAGDAVLTTTANGALAWTRVVVNQHRAVGPTSPMVRVEYDSGHGGGSLELTPDHVMHLDDKFAPARDVRPGDRFSPNTTVTLVGHTHTSIINPVTTSGTILAAGATGDPVLSSVYGEWIAAYMLGVTVFPLPVSLSSYLAFVFPAHVQAYYDTWLERANAGRGTIDAAMHAVPTGAMPLVAAAADVVLAVGLGVFALSLKLPLGIGVAVGVAALRRLVKSLRHDPVCTRL